MQNITTTKLQKNASGDCISSWLIFIDDVNMCRFEKIIASHITLLPSIIQIDQYIRKLAVGKCFEMEHDTLASLVRYSKSVTSSCRQTLDNTMEYFICLFFTDCSTD
ncbi:hypothetical protein GQX74_002380 [Glossina fuscipes]|nr:hypothetical protein GQX74_002380 [Glossina fuscipes]